MYKKDRIKKWKDKVCNTEDYNFKIDGYDSNGRGIDGKRSPFGVSTIAKHNSLIRKNCYGKCKCKNKNDHYCGWVTLLDSYKDDRIISRFWPIELGLYDLGVHIKLQKFTLHDHRYDLNAYKNNLKEEEKMKSNDCNISLRNRENMVNVERKIDKYMHKVLCQEIKLNYKIRKIAEREMIISMREIELEKRLLALEESDL